ncbi:MAG: [LysW]-lysine hydrolase [Anaerolineales bacterium]|nr:[LysW]-lysine hydrolase [Anaerolineales bacterium]MDW8325619.1 [LysW]-lysine hydrolase [Anaerolineales bacterium]
MDELQLLEDLLKIYSPTGQEAEAVNYLVMQMRAGGLEARVDEVGNAVGEAGPAEATRTVMLLGHIDTVPGFIPVTRDGDRLNGRGAVDAKGPLAAFTAAAIRAKEQLSGLRVIVIGAVGEEGNSRGAHFIKDRYRPDFTIIGEPSGWDKVTLGYKGSAWFDYEVRRALAHTAARDESACEAAVAFWNRVTAWAAERNSAHTRMFEQVLPTLREMSSGSDGFIEHARLKFGVRLPPGVAVDELHNALAALASGASLNLIEGVPAYRGEKNTPLVRALLAAIRQAGGNPSFSVKSGTSDMNIVGPAWGTPIVAYGPGDSALDHTPDEHILLSEYQRAITVLVQTLLRLV